MNPALEVLSPNDRRELLTWDGLCGLDSLPRSYSVARRAIAAMADACGAEAWIHTFSDNSGLSLDLKPKANSNFYAGIGSRYITIRSMEYCFDFLDRDGSWPHKFTERVSVLAYMAVLNVAATPDSVVSHVARIAADVDHEGLRLTDLLADHRASVSRVAAKFLDHFYPDIAATRNRTLQ